jgi:rubrerythrin
MSLKDKIPAEMEDLPAMIAHALAIEEEAGERYADLADQMSVHNNDAVADFFRTMARVEKIHADKIRDQAKGIELPEIAPWDYRWRDAESPETTLLEEIHYKMTVHHALKLALVNEQRAEAYFADIASKTANAEIRAMAEELAEDERAHVKLVEDWLAKHPEPAEGWDEDDDPPAYQD